MSIIKWCKISSKTWAKIIKLIWMRTLESRTRSWWIMILMSLTCTSFTNLVSVVISMRSIVLWLVGSVQDFGRWESILIWWPRMRYRKPASRFTHGSASLLSLKTERYSWWSRTKRLWTCSSNSWFTLFILLTATETLIKVSKKPSTSKDQLRNRRLAKSRERPKSFGKSKLTTGWCSRQLWSTKS